VSSTKIHKRPLPTSFLNNVIIIIKEKKVLLPQAYLILSSIGYAFYALWFTSAQTPLKMIWLSAETITTVKVKPSRTNIDPVKVKPSRTNIDPVIVIKT
jgi:hypothetical protein